MSIKSVVKRASVAAGVAAAVVGFSSLPASASTIQTGKLQFCAQGNYAGYVHVHAVRDPGTGLSRGDFASYVVPKGQCWIAPIDTLGQWAQVDVVGFYNVSGKEFYIGTAWVNSSVSGLGLGAEGTTTDPFMYQW